MISQTSDPAGAEAELRRLAKDVFVGRDREIEILKAGLEQLVSGRGSLYLISGEPGIGKTRLADEIAGDAHRRGIRVAWGRCWEGGGAPSFWPWIQAMRACLAAQDVAEITSRLGPQVADVATLLQELRGPSVQSTSLFENASSTPFQGSASSEPEQARFRLFDSASHFLKLVAERTPLLIVLDDCHSADFDSLMLLQFVAREALQTRIKILVTFRDTEVRQSSRLSELFGLLLREGRGLPLGGLGEDDCRRFIEYSGATPGSTNAVALYQITEGNPFFLTEIVQLLLAEGRVAGTGDQRDFKIPEGVRAAVRRRVRLVSEPTARILAQAAVIGREFDAEILREISKIDEAELSNGLTEAAANDLLRQCDIPRRFRFTHPLIAETLCGDLPQVEQRALHLRIAEALESINDANTSRLYELAHHYLSALPGGSSEKAIEYALAAARRATELVGFEEAVRLYGQALHALGPRSDGQGQQRCAILLELGQAQFFAHEFEESKKTFALAVEIAKEIGRPDLQAKALLGFSSVFSGACMVDHALIEMLEEGLAAIGEAVTPERAMLLARLAAEYYWSGAIDRRTSLSREAVEVARVTGDARALVVALYTKYLALWRPETAEERIAVSAEMVRLVDNTDRRQLQDLQFRAHFIRVGDLLELGEIEAADREIETYGRLIKESRRRNTGHLKLLKAMRALIDGRLDDAEKLALESFTLSQHIEPSAASNLATQLGIIRREQGRMLEMESSIKTFIERYPSLGMARCALALCYCEADRREDARAHFEYMAADDFAALPNDATSEVASIFLSEVCAYLGDTGRADLLYRRLRPWVSRNAMLGSHAFYGPVAFYLGLLSSALSRYDEAQEHFETAIRMTQRIGTRPWLARTQCEYAAMLLRRSHSKDRTQAVELIEAALATASSLGLAAIGRKAQLLKASATETSQPQSVASSPVAGADFAGRRMVATILFVDIVRSTETALQMGDHHWNNLLNQYYRSIRKELDRFAGREAGTFGDDFLALFDSPENAVGCACSIRDATRALGLNIRAGLHAGECEFTSEGKIGGIALHVGARLVRAAEPGEIVVSSTVRDLALGGGFVLLDRGTQQLKGVPGQWRLFTVGS